MADKKCKSCGRFLPDWYKYSKCENCRNKRIDKKKSMAKKTGLLVSTAAAVTLLAKETIKIFKDWSKMG